jgi:hypothetical protein
MRFEPAGQTSTRAPSTWEERRARRALRRDRERARNVGRAAAMHAQRVVRERAARCDATEPDASPVALPRALVGCSAGSTGTGAAGTRGLVKTTDEIYVRFHGVRRW